MLAEYSNWKILPISLMQTVWLFGLHIRNRICEFEIRMTMCKIHFPWWRHSFPCSLTEHMLKICCVRLHNRAPITRPFLINNFLSSQRTMIGWSTTALLPRDFYKRKNLYRIGVRDGVFSRSLIRSKVFNLICCSVLYRTKWRLN